MKVFILASPLSNHSCVSKIFDFIIFFSTGISTKQYAGWCRDALQVPWKTFTRSVANYSRCYVQNFIRIGQVLQKIWQKHLAYF